MGLDQYAWIKKAEAAKDEHELSFTWRKHSRLQEFMQLIWAERGNLRDDFNCEDMKLTKEDIDLLLLAIKTGYRDHFCHGGSFWGHQFQEEVVKDSYKDDLEFAEAAASAMNEGMEVYYSCWY